MRENTDLPPSSSRNKEGHDARHAAICVLNARSEWGRVSVAGECWQAKQNGLVDTEMASLSLSLSLSHCLEITVPVGWALNTNN